MTRRSAAEAVESLRCFQAEHGRLPKSTAADPEEKYLANFLFVVLRYQERRGTLKPELRERAALIPGALALDSIPDQDSILAELEAFIREEGHQPRHSRAGVPEREVRLRNWISNNVYIDPGRKSPRLQARHKAIEALLATAPTYAEKDLDDRITAAEQFITVHGYRPSGKAMAWLRDYAHRVYSLDGPYGKGSPMNPDRAARIKAILTVPTRIEHLWERNFTALQEYVAAHGSLPSEWDQPHFAWLTVQRREYRRGKMSQDRLEKLLTINGAIATDAQLPDAA